MKTPRRTVGRMDTPCVELAAALNRLPGIATTSSCCGHGRAPYRMFFEARRVRDLTAVVRRLERYLGFAWKCCVCINEAAWRPLFFLESVDMGPKAYRQARVLAKALLEDLENGTPREVRRGRLHPLR